ncbi:glutathione S-transferase [Roridomyces roridus]|uniref:glutathione transferase n=1 Tax=Roridomyces roridus TaxID=1738132 RepID=A0AAD7C8R7_9AGAR|nr:glutathione S-transferase [Roridomyces roridus]
MPILKLYGQKQASCTRRAATILHELKVPFELITVDMVGMKTPAYLEHQPFGQIPYIDDNGFELYESRAICRYLVATYGPTSGLIPTEAKAHARFEQAASIELTNFDPYASKAGLQLWTLKPEAKIYNLPLDKTVVETNLAILDQKLEAYDAILGKQRYLGGETLTLADLFHLPYGPLASSGENDIMNKRSNVSRWYNELIARPSWLAYDDADKVKTTLSY